MMLTIQAQITYVKTGILNGLAILKTELQKNHKKTGLKFWSVGGQRKFMGLNLLDKVGAQILRFLSGIENDERWSVLINLR